ncbi:MAG: Tryptophan synthase alpha chain [Myxococcaceae bacterium]|nr:Tryptophan synthase alpha chain [Myxococcaceae bacterium]
MFSRAARHVATLAASAALLLACELVTHSPDYSVSPGGRACPEGSTDCGGVCFELATSNAHCGACDVQCEQGLFCSESACASQCSGGTTACGDRCVSLDNDATSCGICGRVCDPGDRCHHGRCEDCPSGTTACPGTPGCVDLSNDPTHCGSCSRACGGAGGGGGGGRGSAQLCVAGSCAGSSCPSPFTLCGNNCTYTPASTLHCGSCNNQCASNQTCSDGKCVSLCKEGQTMCNGLCVDTQTDESNCGRCSQICLGTCLAGTCT